MPEITFIPSGRRVQAERGVTLLDAARAVSVEIESPCGGAGHCFKCLVEITERDLDFIDIDGSYVFRKGGRVLIPACHAEATGDIEVTVESGTAEINIAGGHTVKKLHRDTYITKAYDESRDVTEVTAAGLPIWLEKGNTLSCLYGTAIDIGTTTLAVSLLDLNSGEELGSVSALNPQTKYAQDVLSRIKTASTDDGLGKLNGELIAELNRLTRQLCADKGVSIDNIYESVVSGNTCMVYLFLNENPAQLGKYPFNYDIKGGFSRRAKEIGLSLASCGLVYVPPVISAFVGADITAGIAASELGAQEGSTLFIDIGTNGEMVLARDGRLTASSTAAGPAFEGMNISCGMRASKGAVEYFDIKEDGRHEYKTIGETEAVGICGSGLLDICAALIRHGLIGKSGRLAVKEGFEDRVVTENGGTVFKITDKVFLSQKDIRQIQLAKGAIRAGIEMMLKEEGIKPEELDRIFVAGSFGFHLQEQSLLDIGLLPAETKGRVIFLGNTSLTGSHALLLNKSEREKLLGESRDVRFLELTNNKEFEKEFVGQMKFA